MSYHMADKNPKKMRIPNDYLPDSDPSEEETSQHLHTSPEERLLAHTMAQCNPTVKRGPAKHPKIKKLPKRQALDNSTQKEEKDKSH